MKAIIIGKNRIVKDLIADLLNEEFGFEVAFLQLENPLEIPNLQQLENADIIMIDLTNGHPNSRLYLRELHEIAPQAKIIAMHHFSEKELINPFIDAGASAYLLINTTVGELINAINAALSGNIYITSEAN